MTCPYYFTAHSVSIAYTLHYADDETYCTNEKGGGGGLPYMCMCADRAV